MKAVAIQSFGGPEVLTLTELPRPKPERGEVLVRMLAAGVNPVDWKIREGRLSPGTPHAFPLIPGWDVAGVDPRVMGLGPVPASGPVLGGAALSGAGLAPAEPGVDALGPRPDLERVSRCRHHTRYARQRSSKAYP